MHYDGSKREATNSDGRRHQGHQGVSGDIGVKYSLEEELEPLSGPISEQINRAKDELNSDHWRTQFDAIDIFRRLAQFHTDTVPAVTLSAMIRAVVKSCDCLRSSIAKNSLMCVREVWFYFSDLDSVKRTLDAAVSEACAVVLKRGADVSNAFISEEADKAFQCLCVMGGFNPLISYLNRDVVEHSRMITRKVRIARGYGLLVRRLDRHLHSRVKEYGPMIKAVIALTSDANVEAKHYAKATINEINRIYNWDAEKHFPKDLSRVDMQKFKEISKKAADNGYDLDDLL